ncbi:MAG TPA: DUF2384 domain-containing protein [Gammaproteobacteria bacterium]
MSVELSDEERTRLAALVMAIFEEWHLDADQQLALLGLPEGTKTRELTRWRRGTPFPQEEALLNRAKHVLGIQESLHVVFPLNPQMPLFWLNNRNRYFKTAPLAVMLEEGLAGMNRVWRHLDCTVNWTE